MKWVLSECKRGDIIRVKDGSLYHYGIFVSENEVIAFGRTPSYYKGVGKNEKIVVLSTSAGEFSNGNFIEKGVPDKQEKRKMRKADEIVACAKSRLGEDGYNIIHNNCEHFVNECAFGIKFSAQEDETRRRWNERGRLNVYICLDGSVPNAAYVPEVRLKSLKKVKSEKLLREKNLTWNTLDYAINASFRYDMKDVKFKKQRNGKWVADKFYFSLSHSCGAAVAVVSDKPCGIDVEKFGEFALKCKNEKFCKAFADKIGCTDTDALSLLKSWTGKECIYKTFGKGNFHPSKVNEKDFGVEYIKTDDYILSVVGDKDRTPDYFLIENGKCRPMLKGDYECV